MTVFVIYNINENNLPVLNNNYSYNVQNLQYFNVDLQVLYEFYHNFLIIITYYKFGFRLIKQWKLEEQGEYR